MTASEFGSPLRDGIRRVLQNEWFVVVVVFLTATAVRWLFHLQHPRANGFLIYQGAPFSDGCSYTFKAMSIAQGHGIPPFQQPAVRPFYPIALACLYTWSGFSLQAIAVLNIVAAGLTAGLIYLCGARALNRFCGLGAALFFAIDPTQVAQTPQAGTEPLGLLLFVASVYAMLRACETQRASFFFLSGLFIGLSNLTRTLTIFVLPFFLGLIFVFGWRERRIKAALIHLSAMTFGFVIVILPWLIHQERSYGIFSISDNIGEAFYSASSPSYKQWTPNVRRDADADKIPDTIGDRYRYFMYRAEENVKHDPGFYLRNIGGAVWEYANTFGSRSRASNRYSEWFSGARKSQNILLVFLLILLVSVWMLRQERPFAKSSLAFLFGTIGLVLFYRSLPAWLTFVPILAGMILSWRARGTVPGVILLGSLVMSVLGSAAFANPILFRSILMTDWLFLFYFLAALSFPAERWSNRFATEPDAVWAAQISEREQSVPFQSALDLLSLRAIRLVLFVLVVFFGASGTRLIALTISNPPTKTDRQLAEQERDAIGHRLQQAPCAVLSTGADKLPVHVNWTERLGPRAGQYVMEIQSFPYDYYIPAGQLPPRNRPAIRQSYGRTLIILPKFDFTIPAKIPSDFSNRPLIFVGVVSAEDPGGKQTQRPQVDGLAVVPLDNQQRPDFTRAICAPATPAR